MAVSNISAAVCFLPPCLTSFLFFHIHHAIISIISSKFEPLLGFIPLRHNISVNSPCPSIVDSDYNGSILPLPLCIDTVHARQFLSLNHTLHGLGLQWLSYEINSSWLEWYFDHSPAEVSNLIWDFCLPQLLPKSFHTPLHWPSHPEVGASMARLYGMWLGY